METKIIAVAAACSLAVVLVFGCGDKDDTVGPATTTHTVSGTLTFPAPVTGKLWQVIVDVDHDGSNGWTALDGGTVTGSSVDYSIEDVPTGNYYIYAEVDMMDNPGPWDPGDYVGLGCELEPWEPCTVAIASAMTIDIGLVVNSEDP